MPTFLFFLKIKLEEYETLPEFLLFEAIGNEVADLGDRNNQKSVPSIGVFIHLFVGAFFNIRNTFIANHSALEKLSVTKTSAKNAGGFIFFQNNCIL